MCHMYMYMHVPWSPFLPLACTVLASTGWLNGLDVHVYTLALNIYFLYPPQCKLSRTVQAGCKFMYLLVNVYNTEAWGRCFATD